jgi:hypothetical protein
LKIEEHRFWLCKCNEIVCQIKGHSELGSPYARAGGIEKYFLASSSVAILVRTQQIRLKFFPGLFSGFFPSLWQQLYTL